MAKNTLQTQSYRGARDLYPEDMQIQEYIFSTWKKVCERYAFERYNFPILEPLEIFAAKTGEEIVNEQLFWFEDKGGRKLAIRPELTPGTVRLIAQKFYELAKPLKWYMIGNNWRYEKPQTGRGREFNQLEVNIFGVAGVYADLEIFLLIVEIMKEFGAKPDQFELRYGDRRLLNALLLDELQLGADLAVKVRRLMDKFKKMTEENFALALKDLGLTANQAQSVVQFLKSDFDNLKKVISAGILETNKGYQDLVNLRELLKQSGISQYCAFDPSIIRGFDYSDGLVYEVFDKNPNNQRSLFGGERFDKLIEIFGEYELPATGFAMGDWTLTEFLTNWNLLPKYEPQAEYFVSVWPSDDEKYLMKSFEISRQLRERGKSVYVWLDKNTKLDKQLKYADKKQIPFVLIVGESEFAKNEVTVKDLREKTQNTLTLDELLKLQ